MDSTGITLSEVSQKQEDKYCMISYVKLKGKKAKLLETESRTVARGQGWEK